MPKKTAYGCDETYPGWDMDADEFELVKAVERYKQKMKLRFVSCTEILKIAKSLGYRRISGPVQDAEKKDG